LRGAAFAASLAVVLVVPLAAPGAVRAEAPSSVSRTSISGNYLAARHAVGERDAAAAAAFYRAALKGDPHNNELLGRTFLAFLLNGEVEDAVKLAV
jgi:hypothetical protein